MKVIIPENNNLKDCIDFNSLTTDYFVIAVTTDSCFHLRFYGNECKWFDHLGNSQSNLFSTIQGAISYMKTFKPNVEFQAFLDRL